MAHIPLLVISCVILHNICIDRWILKGKPGSGDYGPDPVTHVGVQGCTGLETDDEIIQRMSNKYDAMETSGKNTSKRKTMMEVIWQNHRVTS